MYLNESRVRAIVSALLCLALAGCLGMPEGVRPVKNFEADRYLGRWYEIARLDHSFERGLTNVTAQYSRRDDGAVRVINRGFDTDDGDWSEIEGVARFVGPENEAHLKVSFFGPFYGSYVVFDLPGDYSHAFVSGYNTDYLWLLAREPVVSDSLREAFVARATALGFDVDEIVWVEHDQ